MAMFFGFWDSPLCDAGIQMPTPVHTKCVGCEQAIVEGDCGMIMGNHGPDGEPGLCSVHLECQLMMVFGSADHLDGECHCDEIHPDHRREEARRLMIRLQTPW